MVLREFTVKVCEFFLKLMRLAQIHQFAVDGCIQSCPVWPKSHGEWRVPDWESSQLGFSLMYELYLNCRHVENFTEWVSTELKTRFLCFNPTGEVKCLSSFGSPYFKDQILLTWTPKLNNRTKNFCLAGISKTFQQVRSEEIKRIHQKRVHDIQDWQGTRWNGKLGAQDEFHRKSLLRRSRSVI